MAIESIPPSLAIAVVVISIAIFSWPSIAHFFIGARNAVAIGVDSEKFLARMKAKGSAVVPFLPLLGRKAYMILSPDILTKLHAMPGSVVEYQQGHWENDDVFFGVSKSFYNSKPRFLRAFQALYSQLKRTPLDELSTTFIQDLDVQLDALAKRIDSSKSPLRVTYDDAFGRPFFLAGVTSFYGPKLSNSAVEEVIRLFPIYDFQFPKFAIARSLPIPDTWALRLVGCTQAVRARTRLIDIMEDWLHSCGYKTSSGVMKVTIDQMIGEGFLERDVAAVMGLGMLVGFQSNSPKTAFWTLLHIIQSPLTLSRAQKEIVEFRRQEAEYNAKMTSDDPPFASPATLHTRIPFIYSCLYEALRLHSASFSLRIAVQDFQIHVESSVDFDVKRNEIVVLANHSGQNDPDLFDEPKIFKADRFLDYDGSYKGSVHVRSFGGGLGICKGKALAIFTELYLIVRVLELFDVQFVRLQGTKGREILAGCGTKYRIPGHVPGRIGTGSSMPDGEVVVDLSLKS